MLKIEIFTRGAIYFQPSKHIALFQVVILFFLLLLPINLTKAQGLGSRLAGRVLLDVQSHGEAWYVAVDSGLRVYLGRPEDAFNMMRAQGVGISNRDINKIPIGVISSGVDSDSDGLSDNLEIALGLNTKRADTDNDGFNDGREVKTGNNPAGQGKQRLDFVFTRQQKGKIFLEVEKLGQAWYINPADSKRYFLGRPADAFAVMKSLGLGIKSSELEKIPIMAPNYDLIAFENKIFVLVNEARVKAGLANLILNQDLSAVAREHSQDLAKENRQLTDLSKACDFPIIHHEGFVFGSYGHDRLHNREVYYFDKSGENIALMPAAGAKTINYDSRLATIVNSCAKRQAQVEAKYEKAMAGNDGQAKLNLVASEITTRQKLLATEPKVWPTDIKWNSPETVATRTVNGWLASPDHKANMMEADYDATGIGAAYVNGYIITTQIFIRRINCGYKDAACCSKEGYLPYCYEPYICQSGKCQTGR